MAKRTNTALPPHIAIALSGESARPAGARMLSKDGKTPSRIYTKDIISAGTFTHPKHGWKLPVDHARMDRWAETFGKMKAAGVDVEVVADHGTPGKRADKIRGYVKDIFREGDQLLMQAEMIGEDGIKLAETVKNVSVEI